MKTTILCALALLASAAHAQDAAPAKAELPADTLTDVRGARRVTVSETDSVLLITIEGTEGDSTYHYSYSRATSAQAPTLLSEGSDRWDFRVLTRPREDASRWEYNVYALGFGLGFVATTGAQSGHGTAMGRSPEAFFDALGITASRRANTFKAGIGFSVQNFAQSSRELYYERNDQIGLDWQPNPDGMTERHSTFRRWTNYLHLSYRRSLGHHWGVSAHSLLHLCWRGRTHTSYSEGARTYQEEVKNVRTSRFRAELMGQIDYYGVGFYVKYSPSHVLQGATDGVNFRTWSLGLTVGF